MQDFASKRTALFACLDDASKELKGTSLDQGDKPATAMKRNRTNCISADKTLSFMRGKESIFKKPERPITRCLKARKTPDYQMNPHKWKKYSLSDVDISDHTNSAAAFRFLREIDEQQDAGYESQSYDPPDLSNDGERKIEFKKSAKIARHLHALEQKEVADAEVDKPKLKGSILVMPEYVVGQRMPKVKKNKKPMKNTGEIVRAAGTLKLSHLQEYDDDDETYNGDDGDETYNGVDGDDDLAGER